MTRSRTWTGATLGVVVALIWQTLGADVLLWVVILGLAGWAIGYVLEHPKKLIDYIARLEK